VLVPDAAPPDHVAAGQWAESNTQGGCLKVRVSFEEDSLQIDCLPYKLLVFVDNVQRVAGSDLAHLAGRGYVHPEGLTPVLNPAETRVPFESRPHDAGRVAYTTPDGNVWTLGADGANPTQITGGPGQSKGAFYSSLAWSPDGKKLLLRRDTDGGSHDVQIYEPDKGLRTIYPPQGIVAPVNPGVAAWSADSQHILVTDYDQPGNACERQNNQYALRSVDIDTGATVELNRTDGKGFIAGVTASPDGRTIAMLIGSGCDSVSFGICLLSLQPDAAYAVQAGQGGWSGRGAMCRSRKPSPPRPSSAVALSETAVTRLIASATPARSASRAKIAAVRGEKNSAKSTMPAASARTQSAPSPAAGRAS